VTKPRPEVAARLRELRFTRFLNLTKDIPKVKGECAWCGGPSRSAKYCSPACDSEAYIRRGDTVGSAVFQRDGGICAECGINAQSIAAACRDIYKTLGQFSEHGCYWRPDKWVKDQWGPWWRVWENPWQADHIIPVVEGGGCCGLDNYQTLCIRCHKLDTKTLSARLAGRRRADKLATGPQQELPL